MPLAVTHVLLTIIAIDLYRDYIAKHKKYFTTWTLFVGGMAGLASDADLVINFVLSKFGVYVPLLAHGGITHTPIFGLAFLIPFAILWRMKKHKLAVMFLVASFGILFHIFLDFLIGGGSIEGVMVFYPFSTETYKVFLLLDDTEFPYIQGLDAIILVLWLLHEERKHKIKDFI